MKRLNRSKDKKVIIRVACVLLGSVIVSVSALMINFDTFSWFTSKVEGEMSVTAATTNDILDVLKVDTTKNHNPNCVLISKTSGLQTNPIIYFVVEGEISNYIEIEPVELVDSEKTYKVPIIVKANVDEYISLSKDKGLITGTIRVKYLNGFIDEPIDVTFSSGQLKAGVFAYSDRDLENNGTVEEAIADLLIYIASQLDWEEENSTGEDNARFSVMSFNSENPSISSDMYITPVTRLALSVEQEDIINVIAPKLLSHIEDLYNKIDELMAFLGEKLEQIAELTLKVEEQEVKILTLEEEKLTLEGKVTEMTTQNEELSQQNLELNENVLVLGGEIIKLEEDNNKLEKKNSALSEDNNALSDANSSLRSSNARLSEENSQLRGQVEELQALIDQLMTSDDGDTTVPGDVYGSE